VKDAAADRPISWHLDIMPIFMRAGCNTGSCHGAARGKDGFRLSLFGFDPRGDYDRVTREIGFRRINLAVPEESLLIEKSTGAVPHTGGKRFEKDSEYNQTLLRWLRANAPQDPGEPPRVARLDIFPPQVVLEGEGATQQFIAKATYSDGTTRDVTNLATFMTSNDNSAPITADGLVTAAARGEAFVMARFETHTVGSQVLVLPKDLQYTAPAITGNYVDQLTGEKLASCPAICAPMRNSCGARPLISRASCPPRRNTERSWPTRRPINEPGWSIACWNAKNSPKSGP
jgi:hypothetical protein